MNVCTVSKDTGLTPEEILFLEEIAELWRSPGCLLGRDGFAHYMFEPKAEIASGEEMKQAQERVESLCRRLLDLAKIFKVAKFVHQNRNLWVKRSIDNFSVAFKGHSSRLDRIERAFSELESKTLPVIEFNSSELKILKTQVKLLDSRIRSMADIASKFEQLDILFQELKVEEPSNLKEQDKPDPLARIKGHVSRRLLLSLRNACLYDHILKPIEELTDSELLKIRNFGPKSLAEFRGIIPTPPNKEKVDQ